MYAVTLLIQKTKEVVELLGFANSQEEVDALIDACCRKYGADWLGSKGYGFGVELAF